MSTPGRLMDRVAEVTGVNRSKVENFYDELRKSGDVPVGVRGRYGLNVTSDIAAKLLIAVCCAEHVKDAPGAVRRYSGLDAVGSRVEADGKEIIVPGSKWKDIAHEFPRLGKLGEQHCLLDALTALIDSYVDEPTRSANVTISFGSPYPWSEASVVVERRIAVIYRHENEDAFSDEDDPEFLALIDPSKERQRRKFAVLNGDLRITARITDATFSALGRLIRE